jgi:hypothetical protein
MSTGRIIGGNRLQIVATPDYRLSLFLAVLLIHRPTMLIVQDEPMAQFFVLSSIIFVLCFAVLLFIFVPKLQSRGKSSQAILQQAMRPTNAAACGDQSWSSSRLHDLTKETTNPAMIPEVGSETEFGMQREELHSQKENAELKARNEALEKELSETKALLSAATIPETEEDA